MFLTTALHGPLPSYRIAIRKHKDISDLHKLPLQSKTIQKIIIQKFIEKKASSQKELISNPRSEIVLVYS
jgi:hypothetical protein